MQLSVAASPPCSSSILLRTQELHCRPSEVRMNSPFLTTPHCQNTCDKFPQVCLSYLDVRLRSQPAHLKQAAWNLFSRNMRPSRGGQVRPQHSTDDGDPHLPQCRCRRCMFPGTAARYRDCRQAGPSGRGTCPGDGWLFIVSCFTSCLVTISTCSRVPPHWEQVKQSVW